MQSGQGNVVAGVGKLYLAPYGTAYPTTTGAALTWAAEWVDMGKSEGGMDLELTNTFTPYNVDQETMPIFHTLDSSAGRVLFRMAEVHADNLIKAIANAAKSVTAPGAGQVGLDTIKVGGSSFTVWSLGIEGRSPKSPANSNYWRMIKVWRVIAAGSARLNFVKGSKQLVEVELQIEADLTKNEDDRILEIVDMTAAATS